MTRSVWCQGVGSGGQIWRRFPSDLTNDVPGHGRAARLALRITAQAIRLVSPETANTASNSSGQNLPAGVFKPALERLRQPWLARIAERLAPAASDMGDGRQSFRADSPLHPHDGQPADVCAIRPPRRPGPYPERRPA